MKEVVLLISMLFCHVVDDYYLQGILAHMKQKVWWEEHAPDPLYSHDYLMALIEHAFSWTVMIHIPAMVYLSIFDGYISTWWFVTEFVVMFAIHALVDNLKANRHMINLVTDQAIHIAQVIYVWCIFILATY